MPRVIVGQMLAGTQLDRDGDRISPELLRHLFDRWQEDLPLGVSHDVAQRPVWRAFNMRLESLPDGELALMADIEVLDEERFSQFGGFSIAYSRRRITIGSGNPVAEVSVNSRQFEFDSVVESVSSMQRDFGAVEVVERIEKAWILETAIVVIALQIVAGFFNAIGASLFEHLSRLNRSDTPSGPVTVQFRIYLEPGQRVPVILLNVPPGVGSADIRQVNEPALLELVKEQFGHQPIQKVAARVLTDGQIEIDHATGLDGRQLTTAAESSKNHSAKSTKSKRRSSRTRG